MRRLSVRHANACHTFDNMSRVLGYISKVDIPG
jgi:hypothetical protein